MERLKLLGGALVSIFLLLFFVTAAGATILVPGDNVSPGMASEAGTLVAGGIATGTYDTAASAGMTPKSAAYGHVSEGVYLDAGHLDFVYQFTNQNAGVGVTGFGGLPYNLPSSVSTDVYFTDASGTVPSGANNPVCGGCPGGTLFSTPSTKVITKGDIFDPTNTQRSGDGSAVTYGFGNNGGAEGLGGSTPGFSAILIIKTNATQFTEGMVSLQGGPTQNLTGFLVPVAPVPEPGFYGVLAFGLAGLFVAVRYRRKQTA